MQYFEKHAFFFFCQTTFRTRTQRPEFLREISCSTALQIMFFTLRQTISRTQCWNCCALVSHIFGKNFVKVTLIWRNIFLVRLNFSFFHTAEQRSEFLREITQRHITSIQIMSFFRQTISEQKLKDLNFYVKSIAVTALQICPFFFFPSNNLQSKVA